MNQISLELHDVHKSFDGEDEVLNGIDLTIRQGEFLTLLGPSGCGKTTTLRIISGLEMPDSGTVSLDGTDVTNLAPDKRNVNTVFQNYALFPHMSVGDNVGYGLKLKKVAKAEIRERVSRMLDLVQLSGYEKRRPDQLSGGQRQRVAIARALVNDPKVLLLDEPLGALDLQLRRAMQHELKHLQKKLGITFVYITHDQEEAINMSDRIAVMNHGRFEQIGTPDEIYNHPRTSYVATFVGNANILKGTVQEVSNGKALVKIGDGTTWISQDGVSLIAGEPVTLAVRSENVRVEEENCRFSATVREKTFVGGQLRIVMETADGTRVVANRYGIDANVQEEQQVSWGFSPEHAVLVDRAIKDTQEELHA